jgi:hypothetical protein
MWSNEGVLTVIEDLQRDACLWDMHLQITKTVIQKGVATVVLAKKKKVKSMLLNLRKNRHWLNFRALLLI